MYIYGQGLLSLCNLHQITKFVKHKGFIEEFVKKILKKAHKMWYNVRSYFSKCGLSCYTFNFPPKLVEFYFLYSSVC